LLELNSHTCNNKQQIAEAVNEGRKFFSQKAFLCGAEKLLFHRKASKQLQINR